MGLIRWAAGVALRLSVLFGLLLGVSFLFVQPGTGSYVVAVLTLVPIVLLFVASVVIIYTGWDPV